MIITMPTSTPGLIDPPAVSASAMPSKRVVPEQAEYLADTEQEDRGGDGAEQDVLGSSLIGLRVVPIKGDQIRTGQNSVVPARCTP